MLLSGHVEVESSASIATRYVAVGHAKPAEASTGRGPWIDDVIVVGIPPGTT
jgi:hypothetical protein